MVKVLTYISWPGWSHEYGWQSFLQKNWPGSDQKVTQIAIINQFTLGCWLYALYLHMLDDWYDKWTRKSLKWAIQHNTILSTCRFFFGGVSISISIRGADTGTSRTQSTEYNGLSNSVFVFTPKLISLAHFILVSILIKAKLSFSDSDDAPWSLWCCLFRYVL